MAKVCYRNCTIGLAVLATLGCEREPSVAVIGYAFTFAGTPTVEVARDEIASWPAEGPEIRIVYDSVVSGDPADVEVERAERISAVPDLVGIVGHGGSRGSLAAAPVYNGYEIPQIVPIGTSRLLKSAGPWTFMLAPDDSAEGAFIGKFVVERLQARRVSIFYVNDEYGTGLRDGVVTELGRYGISVLDEVSVDPSSDFETLVDASLTRGTPDVVISAARWGETGSVARYMQARVPHVRVVAGDGASQIAELVRGAGPAADSIYVVAFWLPDATDSLSRAFVERFRRVTGREPSSTDAMSHDALMLVGHAIRTVGVSRNAIRRYLLELGHARLAYPGITGSISFRPDRPPRLIMSRVRAGRFVRVVAQ